MAHRIKPLPSLDSINLSEFWKRIKKGPRPNDCWSWLGATTERGYGIFWFSIEGKKGRSLIHRLSYLIRNGNDPGELFVLHSCG